MPEARRDLSTRKDSRVRWVEGKAVAAVVKRDSSYNGKLLECRMRSERRTQVELKEQQDRTGLLHQYPLNTALPVLEGDIFRP